jgi:hypothetical protein
MEPTTNTTTTPKTMAATSSRSSVAHTIFRIFYNTLYFFLCLLLVLLLLVSPGDAIRQALTYTNQIVNIPIIAATYVLAILIVLFVYFLRLYVTRTVLAQIPRNTIPIKKGDVKKQVRQMIDKDLGRSAAIAWEARPKVTGPDNKQHAAGAGGLGVVVEEHEDDDGERETNTKKSKRKRSTSIESKLGIHLPPTKPVWGEIEHNGWGSPTSPDLPNLQYSTILSELPNLIEAKAVSQAPLADATGTLNMDAVELLQRSPHMAMRDYVLHLTSLGVLPSTPAIAEFLDAYERARFAPRPMSNADFRELMHLFAALLRDLGPLDPAVLYPDEGDDSDSIATSSRDGHIDDDAPRDTTPTTPTRSVRSTSSATTSSDSPLRFAPQRTRSAHHGRVRPTSGQHYGTAPTTPMSRAPTFRTRAGDEVRRSTSSSLTSSSTSPGGFAPSRRLYRVGTSSSSNSSSGGGVGSMRSLGAASSAGSVIRLARRDEEPAGGLPYVLRIGDMF